MHIKYYLTHPETIELKGISNKKPENPIKDRYGIWEWYLNHYEITELPPEPMLFRGKILILHCKIKREMLSSFSFIYEIE